ncbi:hypothetical protein [Algoriphagus hitonicola]|uniref:Uncharacterized protein n=1 Tax=Algoriphagus hitonicola TaxID=435880 RepID=A0A1I2UUB8_9BACT|nr:hypothetical protein [Algoriphagus hitonicola]SFG80722.1 hypothetical protein SAMN04487988_108142 [Algoriphagus hitonicola]
MNELDKRKILAFEFKSEKEQVVFGLENGVVSAIFESIHKQHRKELQISLGGLNEADEHLDWLKRPLEIGEEFEFKVVRANPAQISDPSERRKSAPPTDEQLVQVYHDLKKELEEAGLI